MATVIAVYGYSNFGITEGAVAAAKAAGLGWEDAAQDMIFRPLGMSATSARYADFLAQPDRAVLHVPGGARWVARLTRDPDAQSPGGGISSSARDMARWVRMELNEGSLDGKQIVAAAALRETHKPIILTGLNPADQRLSFYGLGWAVSFGLHGPVWEHAGAFTNGARTIVRLLPDQHLGIVVLTNAFPTGIPEALTDSFIDTLFDGHPSRDWTAFWNRFFATLIGPGPGAAPDPYATPPASASPALPLSAYAGTYANDYLGTVRVAAEVDGLVLYLGPDGHVRRKLRHFDRMPPRLAGFLGFYTVWFEWKPDVEDAGGRGRIGARFGR